MRPTIDKMMMDIALMAAQRSTCPEAHVGAVLATIDGRVLSIGYNGVPRGIRHCEQTGCIKDDNGHHLFVVHAELNAIINAAREGIRIQDSILYCTRFPCLRCLASIIQAGITKIVYIGNPARETIQATNVLIGSRNISVIWIGDQYDSESSTSENHKNMVNA